MMFFQNSVLRRSSPSRDLESRPVRVVRPPKISPIPSEPLPKISALLKNVRDSRPVISPRTSHRGHDEQLEKFVEDVAELDPKFMMAIDNAFFERLESSFPGGDQSPWFVYAGLIFQANDRMELIGETWKYIASKTPSQDDQVVKGRKLRESLLKASVLVGFPKGINACMRLRKEIISTSPEVEKELDKDSSLRLHLQRSEKDARGKDFFSRIYAQHTDRVLENMSLASGGDLSEFAINAIYGDLMAEETRLNAKETGLLEFLACYATGGSVWSQAKGHMYGSHNLGNGKAEIHGAINICDAIEKELNIQVNRQPAENWSWISKADKW